MSDGLPFAGSPFAFCGITLLGRARDGSDSLRAMQTVLFL